MACQTTQPVLYFSILYIFDRGRPWEPQDCFSAKPSISQLTVCELKTLIVDYVACNTVLESILDRFWDDFWTFFGFRIDANIDVWASSPTKPSLNTFFITFWHVPIKADTSKSIKNQWFLLDFAKFAIVKYALHFVQKIIKIGSNFKENQHEKRLKIA